jgi:hypothetical protein
MNSKPDPSPTLPPTGGNRVKELFRKYGKVAIGVHLVVYATFFAGAPARRTPARPPFASARRL